MGKYHMDFSFTHDIPAIISSVKTPMGFAVLLVIVGLIAWIAWLYLRPPKVTTVCTPTETIRSFGIMLLNDINDVLSEYTINKEALETRVETACDFFELFYPQLTVEPIRAEVARFNRQIRSKKNQDTSIDTTQLKQALFDLRQKL